MSWLTAAVTANLIGSLILVGVYLYLYLHKRQSCLLLWSIGWGFFTIRFCIQIAMLVSQPNRLLTIIYYTIIPVSGFFIVWGTQRFLGRQFSKYWTAISLAVFAWTVFAVVTDRSFLLINLPVFSYLAFSYIFTGVSFLRRESFIVPSSRIVAWLFILWGLHAADYPFLRPLEWFAPWGFLLGVVFEFFIAFSFLIVYFEKAQKELGQRIRNASAYLDLPAQDDGGSLDHALQQRLAMERLVSSLSSRFITAVDTELDQQIVDGIHSVAEFIGCDRAYLIYFDPAYTRIEHLYGWHPGSSWSIDEPENQVQLSDFGQFIEQLKAGQVVNIPDIGIIPAAAGIDAAIEQHGRLRSLLAIPIRQGEMVCCVFCLGHHQPDKDWLAADVQLLGLTGEILARAVSHRAAMQQIHQSEREKALVLDAVEESIVHVDRDLKIRSLNRAAALSIGIEPEALIGKYCHELFYGRHESCENCPVQAAIHSGRPVSAELRSVDGRTWNAKGYPVRDEQGEIVGGVDVTLEITSKKQTEQKLRLKITQQAQLIDASRHLTESLDVTTVLTRIVSEARQILDAYGCTLYLIEEDTRSLRPVVAIDPPYEDEILATPLDLDRSLTGQAVIHRKSIIFNDPSSHTLGQHIPETPPDENERLIVAPLIIDEQVNGVMCLNRMGQIFTEDDLRLAEAFAAFASTVLKNARIYDDLQVQIAERRSAEQALAESEQHLRMVLEQAPVGIVTLDMSGVVTDINLKGVDILGSPSRQATIGLNVFQLPPIASSGLDTHYRKVLETGQSSVVETWYTSIWGKRSYLRSNLVPRNNGSGQRVGGLQLLEDVTERKQADERIRLQAKTMEAAANGILIADRQGVVVWANPAIENLTGYRPEEVVGQNLSVFNSGKQAESLYQEMWETILSGQAWQGEIINRRKDGSLYYEEMTITPVYDEMGSISHFINIKQDITVEKEHDIQQEAILKLSESLRGLISSQEMAPIITHQFMELMESEGACLEVRTPTNGQTEAIAKTGRWEHVKISDTQRFSTEIIRTKKALFLLPDSHVDGIFAGLTCVAGVSLIAQNEVVGIVWIGRNHEFQENEKAVLASLADLTANALQRAWLHEDTQRRVQQLGALHSIDLAINSSVDINLTLNLLLNQLLIHLEVDAADILLLDPQTHDLRLLAGRGFQGKAWEKTVIPLGKGLASSVALDRKRVVIPNLAQSPHRFARDFQKLGEEFAFYCAEPLIAKGRLIAVLEVFRLTPFDADLEWLDFLETMAGQAAIAIDNASLFNDLQRSNQELAVAYNTTLEGWARALELRDEATEGHTRRVTDLTVRLARAVGIQDADLVNIMRGAMLHDIGKMAVPDRILAKPGSLTEDEWEIMRMHPVHAREMLSTIPYLEKAIDIPYCHHERWDGLGYPLGLSGHEIPLAARIFAVVDIWDALRSERVYRSAWPDDEVLAYIKNLAGTHLDPQIVRVFLNLIEERT